MLRQDSTELKIFSPQKKIFSQFIALENFGNIFFTVSTVTNSLTTDAPLILTLSLKFLQK